jgi:hypothetical protein
MREVQKVILIVGWLQLHERKVTQHKQEKRRQH